MESERLTVAESQFKLGEFSVREFIRAIAKSDLYCSRFSPAALATGQSSLISAICWVDRPMIWKKLRYHSTILDTKGFEAEIDSYLDSDEYQDTFGENYVPYIRGYKTEACTSMVQFTHTFQLVRGASSSSLKGDLAGKTPKLNSLVINARQRQWCLRRKPPLSATPPSPPAPVMGWMLVLAARCIGLK